MNQQTDRIRAQAAELGKLIAASPAGTAILEARKELQADEQAHKILESYQEHMQRIAQLDWPAPRILIQLL